MMHFIVLVALFLGYAATPTAAISQVTPKDTSTPTSIPTTAIDTFPNNVGIWNVSDATLNKTCIVFKAAIQLTLQYSTTTAENKTVLISVPTNASSTGRCTNNDQILVLNWNSELESRTTRPCQIRENTLQFNFSLYNSNPLFFWIGDVNATIHKDSKQFPNATNSTTPIIFSTQFPNFDFRTNQKNSYKCNAQVAESEIKFANMQFEAFRSTSKANFTDSIEDVCAADSTSLDFPRVIFGIIIGVLLLIILLGGVGFYSYKVLKVSGYCFNV